MSVSFYARKARLVRLALMYLRSRPEFTELLRSQMFKFAKEHKFKLDSMLNDQACADVLAKKFPDKTISKIMSMNGTQLRALCKKFELAVNTKLAITKLREHVASVLGIELPKPKLKSKKKAKKK